MFTGAYTALITPFTEDGAAVDMPRLAEQVAAQAEGGVTGVVPCGTTGETPTLSDDEQRAVISHVGECARTHGLQVIAGAGSNDTAHAITLHRFAAESGATAALHVCPYYNKPSQEGLYRHFSAIADSCDLPIVLYNVPGRTGVTLSTDTIVRLGSHPNVQAIKDATGGLTQAGEVLTRTDLAVLSGDDPLTLPFMSLGAIGVVSVLSNLLPAEVSGVCRAVAAGDLEEARRLHFEILPLARALLELDGNPVPVKTAMQILARDTGAVRLPLAPMDSGAHAALEGLLGRHASLQNRRPVLPL
jgi:4-hydroxy-tetrahydrodipicolinate synthase